MNYKKYIPLLVVATVTYNVKFSPEPKKSLLKKQPVVSIEISEKRIIKKKSEATVDILKNKIERYYNQLLIDYPELIERIVFLPKKFYFEFINKKEFEERISQPVEACGVHLFGDNIFDDGSTTWINFDNPIKDIDIGIAEFIAYVVFFSGSQLEEKNWCDFFALLDPYEDIPYYCMTLFSNKVEKITPELSRSKTDAIVALFVSLVGEDEFIHCYLKNDYTLLQKKFDEKFGFGSYKRLCEWESKHRYESHPFDGFKIILQKHKEKDVIIKNIQDAAAKMGFYFEKDFFNTK